MIRSVSLVGAGWLACTALGVSCTKPPRGDGRATGAAITLASASPSGPVMVPAAPHRISGAQARALVGQGALLVDVRTAAEFQSDGVPGAINVPHDEVEARASEFGAKDRPVVLYCHSGRRSGIAARALVRLGYTSVYDLGPRTAW